MLCNRKSLHFGVPIGPELLSHLIIEELLLPSLPSEHLLHVKSGLLHDLVKLTHFRNGHMILEVLQFLNTVDLCLGLAVDVPLTDFFLNARELTNVLFVTLNHALLLHL